MPLRSFCIFLLLAALLAACAGPQPAPPGTPPGPDGVMAGPEDDRAQLWWVPVRPYLDEDKTFLLETRLYRPAGDGPFPLVVINHGVPIDKSHLRETRPGFGRAAHWWVGQGYAVAVPLRRGVGRSQGDFAEYQGACDADDFQGRAYRSAHDLDGVARYLAAQPFVDPHRIVIVGQSAGGFASLALAADPPPGVIGIVDFAGGVGGYGNGQICGGSQGLITAAADLGTRAKLPELWLFSVNDRWFGPIARDMFDAYRRQAKVPLRFVELPPYGADGHATLFRADPAVWAPAVQTFLTTLH